MSEVVDLALVRAKAQCLDPAMAAALRDLPDQIDAGKAVGAALIVSDLSGGISARVMGNPTQTLAVGAAAMCLSDQIYDQTFGGEQ